jgi:choline-sulfatase
VSEPLSRRAVFTAPLILRAASEARPNLLYILADDHAGYVLGAHGNRLAVTPNLDRLAAEGTRFARNYCNSPVCTASRQSFFTGQMPHMAGVTRLPTPLSEDKPTIARHLREAGYTTAVVGKMHFNRPSRPGLHGFDSLMLEQDVTKAWAAEPAGQPSPPGVQTKKLPWQPFRDPASIWLNADKLPYPRHAAGMRGTFIAQQALRFLEEHKRDRFALWVSFQEPHSPFDFPIEDRARFDPARFTPPPIGPEDAPQIPLIFRELSEAQRRGIIAAYYTSVSFLDRNVGMVLDKLRALGLDRNTLVLYMADHGYCLGHHGRFEKHCSYDPALHVPLILRWPGKIRRSVVRDMTESIDIGPTILDLLGAPPFSLNHGRSLRPYVEGRRPSTPRDHIFSEYLENEEACVRTERWKFVFCSGKRERGDGYKTADPTPGRYVRLYDLEHDPGEFTHVSATNRQTVKRLQHLMLERFRTTHPDASREPKGLTPEESLEFYLRPRDV